MTNRKKSLSGLSLIELLLVLILMVTLTGLATTRFVHSYQARNKEQIAKELTSYLRYLQFKAIEEGRVHKLRVDDQDGGLVPFVQDDSETKFRQIKTPFSKRFSDAGYFSIHLDRGREVYFFPDGNMTKNKLFVMHNDHKEATLEVKNRIGAFQVTHHH